MNEAVVKKVLWRIPPAHAGWFVLMAGALLAVFYEGLFYIGEVWLNQEEYSHGVMIPFISAFLIWQRKNEIARQAFEGSWLGVALVVLGLLLFFLGEMSTLYIIEQYAFLVVLTGAALGVTGPKVFRSLWVPLLLLLFVIPLPNFLQQGLSTKLQLLSSMLGVSFIRFCDISVYLEGNVIDLGSYKLQVLEACNGLRYLFPLMSVAFICAYFYQEAFWKRAAVFLSSIPITVVMNSMRIGVIGVLVEYWGQSMAEGFLHDFEGWVVFMACTALLLAEMWLLARIGQASRPFAEVFGLAIPAPWPENAAFRDRPMPRQFWVVLALLAASLAGAQGLERRDEIIPVRADFAEFPMKLQDWVGRRETMEQIYIDQLQFDDYILANFSRSGEGPPVNLYSAYYASQRKGASIHSPSSCLPGGGWEIKANETISLAEVSSGGVPLRVNRVLIRKGDASQIVYYWFRQRGRNITDEYLAKWYLFWDALTKNRTDGALIRLTALIPPNEEAGMAERRLVEFLRVLQPQLKNFIAD